MSAPSLAARVAVYALASLPREAVVYTTPSDQPVTAGESVAYLYDHLRGADRYYAERVLRQALGVSL